MNISDFLILVLFIFFPTIIVYVVVKVYLAKRKKELNDHGND